jgi:hypothetical protein
MAGKASKDVLSNAKNCTGFFQRSKKEVKEES